MSAPPYDAGARRLIRAGTRKGVLRMAVFGDSRTRSSHSLDGTKTLAYGFAHWAEFFSRGRLRIPPSLNFGVNGEDSAAVLSRIAPVLASDADIVAVFCSTNDTAGSAERAANLRAIATRVAAAGKTAVMMAELPRNNYTGTMLAQHLQTREAILRLADIPGVFVLDMWPEFVDPVSATGNVKPGLTYDGVHMTPRGAQAIGRKVADLVKLLAPEPGVLPASNADLYSAVDTPSGNLLANAMVDGTGGTKSGAGVTGAVATSWNAVGSTEAVAAFSKVADAAGRAWQQVALSGTPTNAGMTVRFSQNVDVAKLSPGDRLEGVCEMEFDAPASGVTNAVGPWLELLPTATPAVETVVGGYQNPTGGFGMSAPAAAGPGLVRAPVFTVPPGLTALTFVVRCYGQQALPADLVFRVRACALRKV